MLLVKNWLDAVIRSPVWGVKVKWTISRARVSTLEFFGEGMIEKSIFLLLSLRN